jgi:hypothetical protein
MLSKKAWTLKEDSMIFNLYFEHGPKWALIAQCLPGRSDNSVKNRWNSSISKRIERNLETDDFEVRATGKRKKRQRQYKVAKLDIKRPENQEFSKLPIFQPIEAQAEAQEGIDRSKSSIFPSSPEFTDFFCYLFDHPREGCQQSHTEERQNLQLFENLFPVSFLS